MPLGGPARKPARLAAAAALAFAAFFAAQALQNRFQFPAPSGRAPADRSAGERARATSRSLAGLEALDPAAAPVVLNEVMTANPQAVLDEDLDAPDWIELVNRSPRAVGLSGWSLADAADAGRRWVFPDLEIAPGEHLVVWASGKDRVGSARARALGRVLDPRAEADAYAADASRARVVEAGPPPPAVRRVRASLALPEAGAWEVWIGAQALDDRPARFALTLDGTPLAEPALAPGQRLRHLRLPADLAPGEHVAELAAVEGRVSVSRLSFARPGARDPRDARHVHTSFRLRRSGETLVLLDASGRALDRTTTPGFDPGQSWQRVPDGEGGFRLAPPTPAGAAPLLPPPDTRAYPSVVEGPFAFFVAAPSGAEALHYTRDGSVPTAADPVLAAPLRIDAPGVVRLRGFAGGRPVTPVATRQFWVGPTPALATVLLALDPRQLHDPEMGLVPNNAGRGRLFERIAHALIFDRERIHLDGEVALRIHDGDGIDRGRRTSFRIYLRPTRGLASPEGDPFEPALAPLPTRLIFDASRTAWVDRIAYAMVQAAGGVAPRSRLGQLWLNAGFHNRVVIFEGVDESLLRSRFGHADIDLIKGKPLDLKLGTFERFQALGDRLAAGGWTAADVEDELDLRTLLAVHFTSVFIDASDGGEIASDAVQGYLALPRATSAGPLALVAWDMDHGFRTAGYDTLHEQRVAMRGRPWATRYLPELVVDHLLAADPAFRVGYLREAERVLNHVFTPERFAAALDEVERHAGAGDGAADGADPADPEDEAPPAAGDETEFDRARAVFARRPAELRGFIARALGVAPARRLELSIRGPGELEIDGEPVPAAFVGWYFEGAAPRLSVPDAARARFRHFLVAGERVTAPELQLPLREDVRVEALFE
jgi:hypothetical protein